MTKEENVIPTWKQKLLCTGCAAVLAAGLIPMAAWGGATEGSETENATTFSAETPTNDAGVSGDGIQNDGKTEAEGDAQTSNANTPADGDQNGNGNGQDDGDGENSGGGDTNTGTPTEDNSQNPDGNTGEDDGQNGTTNTNGEGEDQEGPDNTNNTGDATDGAGENDTNSDGESNDNTGDSRQEATYAEVEVTSAGTMSMWPGDGAVLTSPDGEPFRFNDAAREFFDANSFGDYLVSVVSSDPSVVSVVRDNEAEYLENAYYIEAQKPGTATVTLTLKDKEPVSCKITVKSAANADLSKLKFQTRNITMKAGESDHLGAYGFQWLGEEAMEAVGYNFAFASSDDSILDCWINDGSYIAALRPGVVTLSLYYFNPETEEYTQTDTATVTITSPSVLAGSTSSSDISGNIIASNEDLDMLVTSNGIKLDVKIKSESDLTAAQQQGLILVKDATEADRAIPIDISLIDREGDVIHGGEEGYIFPYTVRLKLEGQLAELDPATIQVFYLADDGIPQNITCWVEDGYLYIVTDHFSQYVVTGDLKADSATQTAGNKVDANKVASSKKQTVTATAGDTLPQAGDESTAVVPVVALSAAAAAAAIYLARRRVQE